MTVPGVPYPRWTDLYYTGELARALERGGVDPATARAADLALKDILDGKAREEEANYEWIQKALLPEEGPVAFSPTVSATLTITTPVKGSGRAVHNGSIWGAVSSRVMGKWTPSGTSLTEALGTVQIRSATSYTGDRFNYASHPTGLYIRHGVNPVYLTRVDAIDTHAALLTPPTIRVNEIAYADANNIAMVGFDNSNIARIWFYNIPGNSWSLRANPPINTTNCRVAYHDGYVYAFGGSAGQAAARHSVTGNTWQTLTSAPASLTPGSATVVPADDIIYFIGGQTSGDPLHSYDPVAGTWAQISVPISGMTTSAVGQGRLVGFLENAIWVVGGSGGTGSTTAWRIS